MKSEQEFIDGIYKKAELQKKKAKKKVWQSSFAAAAVVGVILLPYGIAQQSPNQVVPRDQADMIRIASVEESIFDGCITNITHEDRKVVLQVQVERQYTGTLAKSICVEYPESDKYTVEIGEKALFYVLPQADRYSVNSNSYGICTYVGENGNWRQYKTTSGEIVNMSENEK